MNIVKCQHCQAEMAYTTKAFKNYTLQLVGLVIAIAGIIMMFFVPVGTVAGLITLVIAARMGYSKRKIWLCGGCGFFYEAFNG